MATRTIKKRTAAKSVRPAQRRGKHAARRSLSARPGQSPTRVKLLSGGNPQIPKGDGDAPVQAFIAAMPGWKRDIGRRLDALVVRTVPAVRKAVRWNTPFYGMDGQGWFMGFHCFDRYVKVVFLRGASLRPLPPVGSKDPDARYFHVYEDGQFDEALAASWIAQASKLPGWDPSADMKKRRAKAAKPAAKTSVDPAYNPADWRSAMLERIRKLFHQAAPDVVEEVKWRKPSNPAGVPVWSHAGIICTGETYRDKLKLTFPRGAALADPAGLFNAGLEGAVRRAIDLRQGEKLDERAFKSLIRAAVKLNTSKASASPAGRQRG